MIPEPLWMGALTGWIFIATTRRRLVGGSIPKARSCSNLVIIKLKASGVFSRNKTGLWKSLQRITLNGQESWLPRRLVRQRINQARRARQQNHQIGEHRNCGMSEWRFERTLALWIAYS